MDEATLRSDYSAIRRLVAARFPHTSADDVVQESYAQAFAYSRRAPARITNPAGLVWTIARRQAQRPAFATHTADNDSESLQPRSPDVEPWEAADAELKRRALRHAVLQLPTGYKDVIQRYYLQEQSCKQIAAELDLTRTAVRSRLYRGRAKLRVLLGDMIDGD